MKKSITAALILLLASNNFFLLFYGAYQYTKAVSESEKASVSNILDSALVFAKRALYSQAAGPSEISDTHEYKGAVCSYVIKTIDGKRSMITVSAVYKGKRYERVYLSSL